MIKWHKKEIKNQTEKRIEIVKSLCNRFTITRVTIFFRPIGSMKHLPRYKKWIIYHQDKIIFKEKYIKKAKEILNENFSINRPGV